MNLWVNLADIGFDLLHDYNILSSPFLSNIVVLFVILILWLCSWNSLLTSFWWKKTSSDYRVPLSPAYLDLSLRNFNLFLADPNAKIYCLEAKPDRLSLLSFIATKTFAHGQHTQTCLTDKLFSYSTLQSLNGRLEWFSLRNSLGSRGWCESVLMP